jgi:acetyl-CoA carboxylase biotin carboxyl carrier protein
VRRSASARAEAAVAPVPEPAAASAPSSNGNANHEPAATVLRAEFVGIVRLSRPAVAAGSALAEDRELAYVESLGIRNPVRSGGPGRVRSVFVGDGEAVEYGQPLFAIEA